MSDGLKYIKNFAKKSELKLFESVIYLGDIVAEPNILIALRNKKLSSQEIDILFASSNPDTRKDDLIKIFVVEIKGVEYHYFFVEPIELWEKNYFLGERKVSY